MDFNRLLNAYHARVDVALARMLPSPSVQSSPLSEAMHYGALLGGKRLRPFLVYATGEMFGIHLDCLDVPAAAVECIHAYSLIHDDLPAMDNDSLRRGHPTCHVKFGEDIAILAGDALQTRAFSILAENSMPGILPQTRIEMIACLARASGAAGMCEGQALDLAAENQPINLSALEHIHHYKTGALIRAAVHLGALAAGDTARPFLPELDRYASAIGLAFQVQDDILDVVGNTEVLGKHQGADQALGKSTYPALMGLKNARHKARALYQESLRTLTILAEQSLDTTALESLANFIIERDK